jgi:hypothetical protein
MEKFKIWTLVNYQRGNAFWAITNNGSRFVAIGLYGVCWTSEDGKNWTPGKPITRTNTFDLTYAESKFVVVGAKGFIATSSDGINWTKRNKPTGDGLGGVAYGDGKFVAVGNNGTIVTSPNGINWTKQTSVTIKNLADVVYGGGLFVAVGVGGVLLTSRDGISWTHRFTGESGLVSAAYGAGKFVVGGRGGLIYTGTDGISWTKRNTGTSHIVQDIVYTGSNFIAAGTKGMLMTSPNGSQWTLQDSKGPTNIMGLDYMNDKVVGVGLAGQIIVSLYNPGAASPELIMASPNGREEWNAGDKRKIRWGSFGTVGNVKLEYSTDNGGSWKEITSSTANKGSYPWTVPDKSSSGCLVRVSEVVDGKPSDTSNAAFTIRRPDEGDVKTLTVIAPNGGEQLDIGKEYTIRWTSGDVSENIRIRFSSDGGNTWTKIFQNTPNTGSCKWTVPDVHSADCLIRINAINTDGVPNDVSNNTFAIGVEASPITLTSPKGGDVWRVGSTHDITWTGTGVGEFVRLEISTDNGSSWKDLDSRTRNDGIWDGWVVPDTPSSKCLIRVSDYSNSSVNDTNDSPFTIGAGPSVTLTSPKGGEVWEMGSPYDITWTSKGVGEFVKIEISFDGGNSWEDLDSRTRNDGIWDGWVVPDTSASSCLIRVSDYSDSSVNDTREIGLTMPERASITLNSPNGGENWLKGSTQTITWTTSGPVDNVKIQYSIDNGSSWDTIIESTPNSGSFSWTLPDISSDQCMVKVSDASDADISDTSDQVFSITGLPEIALSKTGFDFRYTIDGEVPTGQALSISNSGDSTLNWTAAPQVPWINAAPASGTGDGTVTISVDPSGLGAGEHSGTIMVSDPDAANSPQIAAVSLTVKEALPDQPPFGEFATPEDGTTGVTGSIAVTGWALAAKGVASVKIYREVNEELSYIGDAVFVEGARPDVEKAYPDYPNNSSAGWGYMLLTNFLPDGELVLKAIAKGSTDEEVVLGTKTIYLDNQNAVKPFGAIDKPAQGGEASGTNYRCQGWVLTPPPNKIPEDGSTINVFIDGKLVGKAKYNIPRADIAKKFPDCANSNGAMAYFDFDTTAYENGVHTIEWSVKDNAGNSAGIGSRYFTIRNP